MARCWSVVSTAKPRGTGFDRSLGVKRRASIDITLESTSISRRTPQQTVRSSRTRSIGPFGQQRRPGFSLESCRQDRAPAASTSEASAKCHRHASTIGALRSRSRNFMVVISIRGECGFGLLV